MNVSAMRSANLADPVVLCVDDDPVILGLIRRKLEKCGYRVLTAACGEAAMDMFSKNQVDLVVVDYDMPGMNGHELAVKVKSLKSHIPVVMQSGTADLPEEVTGAADVFFPKGFDLAPLLAAISGLINSKGNSLSA